jgi:hypothetical protein
LTKVSDHFGGRTIEIISGYRPYRKGQWTRNSRHNHGKAIDFRVVGVPNAALRDYCGRFERVGVGYYPNSYFVHLDVRKRKTRWVDYSRPGKRPVYAKDLARRRAAKGAKNRGARKTPKKAAANPRPKGGGSANALAAPLPTAPRAKISDKVPTKATVPEKRGPAAKPANGAQPTKPVVKPPAKAAPVPKGQSKPGGGAELRNSPG